MHSHPDRLLRNRVNPDTKLFARQLRKNMTASERTLWKELRSRKLGARCRRQVVLRGWIADFVFLSQRLIVELDGSRHDYSRNKLKDTALAAIGFVTLRFPSASVFTDMAGVLVAIKAELDRIGKYQPGEKFR